MDGLDLDLLPGRAEHEARQWRANRKRQKELAELRTMLPPSDKEAELLVLGAMVDGQGQFEIVAQLLDREDFYNEELGRLFEKWKAVATLPKGAEQRKRVGREMMANGVAKVTVNQEQLLEVCSKLRAYRQQRRTDAAREAIYLYEGPGWDKLVERELAAVRAIKDVPIIDLIDLKQVKEAVNGKAS